MTLADRLRHVGGSPTLALAEQAKALAKTGKAVLDFTAGEPDFPTPAHIKEAGIKAIQEDRTRYTPVAGIPELRAAIAASVNRQRDTSYQPSQVIVTCGTKHALFNVFQALCQPDDEVLVMSPYWVSFPPLVELSGAKPVIIPTREEEQFLPDPACLRAAVTPATKVILLNSPSNPTGAVMDEPRLRAIAELALERNLLVVSDEIYDQMVYPPAQHRSIVQVVPAARDRTVLVGGVSKTYSMTGWRIGYAAGPQWLIDAMTNLQSHSTSNPTSISQYAALTALTGDQQPVARMVQEFHRRRDRLVNGLNALPMLRCSLPGGAFYAWCKINRLGAPAHRIAARWLNEALLAVVPGDSFGQGEFVRMSFATSLAVIDEALARLATWCQAQASAKVAPGACAKG